MGDGQKNIPYGLILSLTITIAGYGVTFGVCQNKIDQNEKDIVRIERQLESDTEKLSKRQDNTDVLLQSINSQLIELNTKMSLLLNGKIDGGK